MGKRNKILTILAAIVVISASILAFKSSAPLVFPTESVAVIKKGMTVSEAADVLSQKGLIRSPFLFKAYATVMDRVKGTGIKTGEYLFSDPQSVISVASRLVNGIYDFPVVKITIPEGSDSSDIASTVAKFIPKLDKASFLPLAKSEEGYLFPETYFWPTNVKPEQIISDMKAIFGAKIASSTELISKLGKSQSDVIKMASIIEKEATSSTDRRIIAGILWKRISLGMPLQVDPPFDYFLNKKTADLTLDDLKIQSPYNLYLNKGLPPTPIDNPGLGAILDTLNPTKTSYLYYLSGKDGVTRYASTLEGHAANKNKYLN